ncbi:MAG: hypothetical protein M3367_03215 [Acidobacteriota bacterium]|nr:hypothetical protein [Acidobacteriota bacterium]
MENTELNGRDSGCGNPKKTMNQQKHYISTTCIECGARGQIESDNSAIIHKTILCAECSKNHREKKQ